MGDTTPSGGCSQLPGSDDTRGGEGSDSDVNPTCRVPGCQAQLGGLDVYTRVRSRVCLEHRRADTVELGSVTSRFCQQCTKFHPITAFEGNKRGCIRQLEKHNARQQKRRRRQQAEAAQSETPDGAKPSAQQQLQTLMQLVQRRQNSSRLSTPSSSPAKSENVIRSPQTAVAAQGTGTNMYAPAAPAPSAADLQGLPTPFGRRPDFAVRQSGQLERDLHRSMPLDGVVPGMSARAAMSPSQSRSPGRFATAADRGWPHDYHTGENRSQRALQYEPAGQADQSFWPSSSQQLQQMRSPMQTAGSGDQAYSSPYGDRDTLMAGRGPLPSYRDSNLAAASQWHGSMSPQRGSGNAPLMPQSHGLHMMQQGRMQHVSEHRAAPDHGPTYGGDYHYGGPSNRFPETDHSTIKQEDVEGSDGQFVERRTR